MINFCDLQSFHIFNFPIVIFPFLQILASLIFREELSIFLLGQVKYCFFLFFFSFCSSDKLFLLPSILNDNITGQNILGYKFFLSRTLNISCYSLLAYKISVEKLAGSFIGGSLVTISLFFYCCLQNPLLNFVILIMIYLGVGVFGFILFGILSASISQISISFHKFGKFTEMISSDTFSIPFSLSSPENPVMCRLAHFILSYRYNVLFQLKKKLSFCLLFWWGDFHYFIFQITDYSELLVCCLLPLAQFLSQQF